MTAVAINIIVVIIDENKNEVIVGREKCHVNPLGDRWTIGGNIDNFINHTYFFKNVSGFVELFNADTGEPICLSSHGEDFFPIIDDMTIKAVFDDARLLRHLRPDSQKKIPFFDGHKLECALEDMTYVDE